LGTDAQTELAGAAEIGAHMGRRSLIVLYAALLAGGGCTSTVPPLNDGSPQGPAPNYRTIIAKSLTAKAELPGSSPDYFKDRGGIFPADKKLDHVEISDTIRMVQTNLYGWAWEACIRLNVNNSPATYAVFISDGVVVDARAAIRPDNCGDGNYAPLEIREERTVPAKRTTRKIGN
jgi:hypothetical protein